MAFVCECLQSVSCLKALLACLAGHAMPYHDFWHHYACLMFAIILLLMGRV